VQLDLTYPIHRHVFHNTDICLQVQYANALAENLIHYRDRTEALRIGIAIVR
jgi:phospholipase A1